MAAVVSGLNFSLHAGNSFRLDLTITENGSPVDLTDALIVWEMAVAQDAPVLVTKTLANGGITITDAVAGVLAIKLAPADTQDLRPGSYYHETRITDGLGDVSTVTPTGVATILPSLIA